MTKKLFFTLFLVISVMLIAVPVSADAPGGTAISTVVPQKYVFTLDITDGGSVEYGGIIYRNGDTLRVTEGESMTFKLQIPEGHKLKSVSYDGQDITDSVSDGAVTIENPVQNGALVVTYEKIGSIIAPITGDTGRILLWSALASVSLVALVGITIKTKKSKHS